MDTHLFLATVLTTYQAKWGHDGSTQYVVAEGRSRSLASQRAMRKVYALQRNEDSLHSVTLEWKGTVEVAR